MDKVLPNDLQLQVPHEMSKISQELLCGDPQLSQMELLLATSWGFGYLHISLVLPSESYHVVTDNNISWGDYEFIWQQ